MSIYKEIYDFAASAGSLEGFVYIRQGLAPQDIDDWVHNLVSHYKALPEDVRSAFQGSLDRTLGRTVASLVPHLGEDHSHIHALTSIIAGKVPDSFQDFEMEKEEKARRFRK
jgi:sporulation-control protein spo0M